MGLRMWPLVLQCGSDQDWGWGAGGSLLAVGTGATSTVVQAGQE